MRKELEQININKLPISLSVDNFNVIIRNLPIVDSENIYDTCESKEYIPHILLIHNSRKRTMIFDRSVKTSEQLQNLVDKSIDYYKGQYEK